MGREREVDRPPADVDVGVVVRLLGEEPDLHHERDGGGEPRPLERLPDLVALARPAGEPGEALGDGLVVEALRSVGHAPSLALPLPRPTTRQLDSGRLVVALATAFRPETGSG